MKTRTNPLLAPAFLLLLGLAALHAGPAGATLMVRLAPDELVRLSPGVVHGVVTEIWSGWSEDGRTIVTYVTVEVIETWKGGDAAPGTVLLRIPGGEADGVGMTYAGMPRLDPGEEIVAFVRPTGSGDGEMTLVGLCQGLFRVEPGPEGDPVAVRDLSGVQLVEREAGGNASEAAPGGPEEIPLEVLREVVGAPAR